MGELRVGTGTEARTGLSQKAIKEGERALMEETNSRNQWSPRWGPPGKKRRNKDSRTDHSWHPIESPAVEAILSKPPLACWYVDGKLQVHFLDTSLVRVGESDNSPVSNPLEQVRQAVLQVYVNAQRDFIHTGDMKDLKDFNPQEHEYDTLFGPACRTLLHTHRPTGLLEGQYFYLPSGSLCAATILHSAVSEPAIRAAFDKVFAEETAVVAAHGNAFSAEVAAKKLATILGIKFDAHQFRYWCAICKPGIPIDSRKRKTYWLQMLAAEDGPETKQH